MMDWGLWLLPVRQKCILIYGSHLWNLNQELWPTRRRASGPSNKAPFIPRMERLSKGREAPPPRIWTLPSTPVSSWNVLNQFLLAELIEKVKKFSSRLRNRACLSCLRGSRVLYLMKVPFKGRNSHLPRWQPDTCSQNSTVPQLAVCPLTRRGMRSCWWDGHPRGTVQYGTRKPSYGKIKETAAILMGE